MKKLRIFWILAVIIFFVTALLIRLEALDSLPTRQNPIIVDKENKKVLIYAEVNSKSINKRNVHFGIVFNDGKLADKAILRAYCNHLNFHDALIAIGATPGDNLTKESIDKYVEGDELIVTATWPGLKKELALNDIFTDSSGKGFKIKFGGNRASSEKEKTGCITCLESCWVGITSNSAYPAATSLQRLLSPNSVFKIKKDVLPAINEHPVIISYKLIDKRDVFKK